LNVTPSGIFVLPRCRRRWRVARFISVDFWGYSRSPAARVLDDDLFNDIFWDDDAPHRLPTDWIDFELYRDPDEEADVHLPKSRRGFRLSTTPTEVDVVGSGPDWSYGLLLVEPLYEWRVQGWPNNTWCKQLRVLQVRDFDEVLGPQASQIRAMAAMPLTQRQTWHLQDRNYDGARWALMDDIKRRVHEAGRSGAVQYAEHLVQARRISTAVRHALVALVMSDLLEEREYRVLTRDWIDVVKSDPRKLK